MKITNKKQTETTTNFFFPKKDHAIIFNIIDGILQTEYIFMYVLSQITITSNIKFASRISNNRFSMYFSKKNIVSDIINQNPTISVKNHHAYIHRKIRTPILTYNFVKCINHYTLFIYYKSINNTLTLIIFVKMEFLT